jgi:phenylpropionate dioxygenase-like ring-hydroxylating dioxygenase large terminal subunit
MNMESKQPKAARVMGPTYQEVLDRDGDAVPVLRLEAGVAQSTDDIPLDRFTSQEFFDLEMKKMWRKVWQYACRDEHLPEPGDYYVYDIGRHSIVLVRTEDGAIKGYHNSCLHRGTKLKPSGSSGYSPKLQCPYHGWTWNLDGTLNEVPCSWEFPHLDYEKNRLPEVQVDVWNTLVFINMDLNAPPLCDYLGVLPEHGARWDFTDWYVSVHARKELACNWKAAQEAFIEGYHGPMVHPQLSGSATMQQHDIFDDHISRDIVGLGVRTNRGDRPMTEQEVLDGMLMGDRSLVEGGKPTVPDGGTARQVMARQMRDTFRDQLDVDLSGMSTSEVLDSIKYTVFPNLFIFTGISLRILYQYRPLGNDPDRCLFDILFMRPVPKGQMRPDPAPVTYVQEHESYRDVPGMDPGFGLLFDQDTQIMRWQNEGNHASEKGAITYSVYMESRLRHLHDTLDKYLRA